MGIELAGRPKAERENLARLRAEMAEFELDMKAAQLAGDRRAYDHARQLYADTRRQWLAAQNLDETGRPLNKIK